MGQTGKCERKQYLGVKNWVVGGGVMSQQDRGEGNEGGLRVNF